MNYIRPIESYQERLSTVSSSISIIESIKDVSIVMNELDESIDSLKNEIFQNIAADVKKMIDCACEIIRNRFKSHICAARQDLVFEEKDSHILDVFNEVFCGRSVLGLNEQVEKLVNSLGFTESTIELKRKDLDKATSILTSLKSAKLTNLAATIASKFSHTIEHSLEMQITSSIVGVLETSDYQKVPPPSCSSIIKGDLEKIQPPAKYRQRHYDWIKRLQTLTDSDVKSISRCANFLAQKSVLDLPATLARFIRTVIPKQSALHYESIMPMVASIFLISPSSASFDQASWQAWSTLADRLSVIVK